MRMDTGIVICHGKSEYKIAEYIGSKLKIPIKIDARSKGESSIQINSLMNFLDSQNYKTEAQFRKKFCETGNFRIFPIMDLDDVGDRNKIRHYKDRSMFKKYWLHPHITPIHNDANLEEVLKDMGYKYAKESSKKGKFYEKVFPMHRGQKDIEAIEQFYEKCKSCQKTNMDEFIRFCLKTCQRF